MSLASLVYALCALTSLTCAILLARGYLSSRFRLLLWSSLCFAGFFLHHLLLLIDVGLLSGVDLLVARQLPTLVGIALLLYGLIWEGEQR